MLFTYNTVGVIHIQHARRVRLMQQALQVVKQVDKFKQVIKHATKTGSGNISESVLFTWVHIPIFKILFQLIIL